MSESLPERLSRFTPDGSAIDRDGLLFAAGRASARPNRRWQLCVSGLAASQVVTLLLWLPWNGIPSGTPFVSPERMPATTSWTTSTTSGHTATPKLRALTSASANESSPAPAGSLVPDAAPWHALASPPADLL